MLQRYDISDEYVSVYTPQVAALLEARIEACRRTETFRKLLPEDPGLN